MPSFARFAFSSLLLLALLSRSVAQPTTPSAPADRSAVADLESKLSVALRSYSLIDAELDRMKAANTQLAAEKAALEVKLAEAQAALPLAVQTVTLRDQLRQTQAQMAAYAEENVQLRTKLSLSAPDLVRSEQPIVASAPTPTAPVAAATTPAPTSRTHTITAGDTLGKISQTYYGTPNRWNDILAANRDVLRDEKSLTIGRTLIIP